MFAVRLKSTGKFLKSFSGSYMDRKYYRSESPLSYNPTKDELRAVRHEMFSEDTPNNAKLYMKQGSIKSSLGSDFEYAEIVPVKIVEA